MKKHLSTIFFIFAVLCCTAMAQNSTINKISLQGSHIVIRNYSYDREIIFGYGNNQGPTINPSGISSNTTIAIRDFYQNIVTKIADLPMGYEVHDAQIVSLGDSNGKSTDFCVFCGTKMQMNSYYNINGSLVFAVDSSGFVGIFCLDNPQTLNNNVYIKSIDSTKHLFKMAAYSETNACLMSNCSNPNPSSIVLDIVGEPIVSANLSSCMVRVWLHPMCSSNILWDTKIRHLPANSTEKFVDITATDNYIVTASVFSNDSTTVRLRANRKEVNCTTFVNFSNTTYDVNLGTLAFGSTSTPTYFKSPVKVTHLTGDDVVLCFAGVGTTNNNVTYDGLFSFRFSNTSITGGWYDAIPCTLIAVSRYLTSVASVALVKLDSPNTGYQINTLAWNGSLLCQSRCPIYSLSDNSSTSLQSVDCSNNLVGQQYLRVGGLIYSLAYGNLWRLIDHKYFTAPFTPDCLTNQRRCASATSVSTSQTYGEAFNTIDIQMINPDIAIPVSNTNISINNTCTY